jgi:hypothetical protein
MVQVFRNFAARLADGTVNCPDWQFFCSRSGFPMRHRDFSWTVALCLSLAIHAAVIRWRAEAYVSDHNPIRLAALSPIWIAESAAKNQPDDVGLLGDDKGTGYATDASPGDLELLARKGEQDQSNLSRDPQSLGQPNAQAMQSLTPPGDNGANGSRAAQDQTAAQSENHPFGVQQTQQPAPAFKTPQDKGPGPNPAPHPDTPPAQTAVAQSAVTPVSPPLVVPDLPRRQKAWPRKAKAIPIHSPSSAV